MESLKLPNMMEMTYQGTREPAICLKARAGMFTIASGDALDAHGISRHQAGSGMIAGVTCQKVENSSMNPTGKWSGLSCQAVSQKVGIAEDLLGLS